MIQKQFSDEVIMTDILSRNNILCTQFVTSPKLNGVINLSFLPCDTRILATSEHGCLILIKSSDPSNCRKDLYHVCKPATKQGLLLPNPNSDFVTQKFAIVIMGFKPLDFKIIRLSLPFYYSQKTNYYYEIFDSTTKAWTSPYRTRFPKDVKPDNKAQTITIRDSVYMLLTNAEILKINTYFQDWELLSAPHPSLKHDNKSYTSKQLVKYEGKLGFTCISPNGCLEMWVFDVYEEAWEKVYVVNKEEEDRAWKKTLVALYDLHLHSTISLRKPVISSY